MAWDFLRVIESTASGRAWLNEREKGMMERYIYYDLKVCALDDQAEDFWAVEDAVWNHLYGLELEGQDPEMCHALVNCAPSCDWHGYNEDMLLLSAKFPAVRLSLVGEEEYNSWEKIYENGLLLEK